MSPAQPGSTSAEVARRLAGQGANVLPAGRRAPMVVLLLREMVHFFALMLWVAAALALVAGMPQPALAIVSETGRGAHPGSQRVDADGRERSGAAS
ncbi:cation-transporting P-type ATPase [Streptosporangium sp. CA-135522]|uniref:cation-transporting P-type ATPase n=1 Tax=Streptosporangium sp. CA-135522 TaxID=3240072 RepID=UPI003D89EF6D